MRLGGFPARATRGLSLLLYSPGSHGGHIKWPPARAELATNLNSGRPGPGIRRARRGNGTCQKRGRFILVGFTWGNATLQRRSGLTNTCRLAVFSEVCGKFWTRRAHRGFAITNQQVERLSICGVVDPSRFCRILPKFSRISLVITAYLTQNGPFPLVGSGPKSYE